ncbi:MAG: hypothetical protein JO161_06230 [Planctomycetaceae bacterium]|nr:hypothetical protein [Planctomycetaceae bacterium]
MENRPSQVVVVALQAQNQALRARIDQLEWENHVLREQLDEALRTAARQAAPFRRPQRKKIPVDQKQRPGRKPEHQGAYRAVPDHVDEQAEVSLPACPRCGGPVAQLEPVEQFIEAIPPTRPRVTRLVTYSYRRSPPFSWVPGLQVRA